MSSCFVMMPFGSYFDDYYTAVIRPALQGVGVSCVRADEIYSTRAVITDIFEAIARAHICLADVTGRNPNVSYELGMAHALGKPTILITQRLEDVPFDYRHLRTIEYEPKRIGWEKSFKEIVGRTASDVVANPKANQVLAALPANANEIDAMRRHLSSVFLAEAYDLDRTNRIYVDEQGHSTIRTSWRGKTKTGLYHLCHNVVCDAPGPIEIRRAYDRLNARDLDWIRFEEGPTHLTYFFLFKQFKEPGQTFEAETEVYAPGYLNVLDVIEGGEALMSTQAVALGIRYIQKTDSIYLPKLPQFANVTGEYISHPRSELVGRRVPAVDEGSRYVIHLRYEADEPYQQETAARLVCAQGV